MSSYDPITDFPTGVYDAATTEKIHMYLSQLNDTQLKAYRIARRHLGTSFNLVKSNGFVDWLKENK
jgi:hypothetical protein